MTEMARGVRPWICSGSSAERARSGIPAVEASGMGIRMLSLTGLLHSLQLYGPSPLTTPKVPYHKSQLISNLLPKCPPRLPLQEFQSSLSLRPLWYLTTSASSGPASLPAIVPISVKISGPQLLTGPKPPGSTRSWARTSSCSSEHWRCRLPRKRAAWLWKNKKEERRIQSWGSGPLS